MLDVFTYWYLLKEYESVCRKQAGFRTFGPVVLSFKKNSLFILELLVFFVLFYNVTFGSLCHDILLSESSKTWHLNLKERLFHAGIVAIQQKSGFHITNQLDSGLL